MASMQGDGVARGDGWQRLAWRVVLGASVLGGQGGLVVGWGADGDGFEGYKHNIFMSVRFGWNQMN